MCKFKMRRKLHEYFDANNEEMTNCPNFQKRAQLSTKPFLMSTTSFFAATVKKGLIVVLLLLTNRTPISVTILTSYRFNIYKS